MYDSAIGRTLVVGFIMRLGLLFYGFWQDSAMAVKYTDIDYYVFSDAAQFITRGETPYKRATYRYTPLLAWILQPNIWWSPIFGKLLFVSCDILAGYLIYCILRKTSSANMACLCAQTWIFNPLPMIVSSRGNAESILAALVLMSLYVFTKNQNILNIGVCSMLYGLSVHMKIYPITYFLPMYLSLVNTEKQSGHGGILENAIGCRIWPTWKGTLFVSVTGSVILMLTGICYNWCGFQFIQETYLYHVTRRDIKHNFSPYFYMLYLTEGSQTSVIISIMAFMPQVLLLLLVSLTFYQDLPFCCFLNTFIFVSFNKVCTSQYFLWYLSILPLIIPQMYMSIKEVACLLLLWFGGQGMWLLPAYHLEYGGQNMFLIIWISGMAFLLVNVLILHRVIQNYVPRKKMSFK